MAVLEIVKYPDPRLRQECESVGDETEGLEQLLRDMAETMYAHNGAGLAAIQVGVAKRIFIVEAEVAGLEPTAPPLAFVDPEISWLSDEKMLNDEGCLSFPGIYVPIERSFQCRARAKNAAGDSFEVEAEGLFSRAIQHENDHLNGRLLADYVGRLKRRMIERRMAREAKNG
jgi:peptide deformylase